MTHPQPSSPGLTPITVSVKQAAQMLGLSTWNVYKLCDQEQIESRYQGRRRLVVVESLHRYASSLPTASESA